MSVYTVTFANQVNCLTHQLNLDLDTAHYFYYTILTLSGKLGELIATMPANSFHFDSIGYLTLYASVHQLTHLIDELSSLPKLIFTIFTQILNIMVTYNTNQACQHPKLLDGQEPLQIQASLAWLQIQHPTETHMQLLLHVLHRVHITIKSINSNHLANLEAHMHEVQQQ